jgi:predicted nucleic acid-binding protein
VKLVLDACVLYPNIMRDMLLGAAKQGLFVPLWSALILEEWARAAARLGPEQAAQVRGEIALLKVDWPTATQPPAPGLEARLWLPDPADIHVLATAVSASADGIVTLNAKDFPKSTLSEEGLARLDPDALLLSLFHRAPDAINDVADKVLAEANRTSGPWTIRKLLKKARLPRLGKSLET